MSELIFVMCGAKYFRASSARMMAALSSSKSEMRRMMPYSFESLSSTEMNSGQLVRERAVEEHAP
ncbi:MAG: hypothetical protein ACLUFV_01885 [Acutalibacteraceae bacterium]